MLPVLQEGYFKVRDISNGKVLSDADNNLHTNASCIENVTTGSNLDWIIKEEIRLVSLDLLVDESAKKRHDDLNQQTEPWPSLFVGIIENVPGERGVDSSSFHVVARIELD
ncbi:MAG TPA: hypothetical protein VMB46_03255 [Methanomassiliicoccales archaeon]|nr:hypothetical protein [Methanomassiliicoccales archaeon]